MHRMKRYNRSSFSKKPVGRSSFNRKNRLIPAYLLFLYLLCGTWSLQGQFNNSDEWGDYLRVRVFLDENHDMAALSRLSVACDHGHYRPGLYLETDFSQAELQHIQQAGFRTEVLIPDVQAYYQSQQGAARSASLCPQPDEYPTPANFQLGSLAGYFTYQEMLDQLDSMRSKYPQLISARTAISSSNLSVEGREIYWLRISDNPDVDEAGEPEGLYTALHHAREPGSLSQLIFYMWYLLENYQSDANIRNLVDNTELYFIPCVNPDGYIYNENIQPSGGGMWRKNRRDNGDGTFGIDLNRNYGYQWAYDDTGSSPNSSSAVYRGPQPFSEPETQNVRDFCLQHNFQLALNHHTFGNLLVYPWGYDNQLTADSLVFSEFAGLMTRENNYLYGTGNQTVGYSTNGDADDWLYGEQVLKNKIISMTPESGANSLGFWAPANSIEQICRNNLYQNLSMGRLLLNYGLLEETGPPLLAQQQVFIPYQLKRFGLSGGNFTVRLQPISSNIIAVGPDQAQLLNPFAEVQDSIELLLDPATPSGDEVVFLLELDNGQLSFSDTIRKTYGQFQINFSDDFASTANWQSTGSWGLSNNEFYSPSSAYTDSPNGNYQSSTDNRSNLLQGIDLRQMQHAQLRFWAKWDIEPTYDYAQIAAAGDDGQFRPLCGQYTREGSSYQDPSQPLYEGQQATWVQESLSLNDFLGDSNVVIQIRMVSDFWINEDGFYIDDIELLSLGGSAPVSTQESPALWLGAAYPNPSTGQIHIPIRSQLPLRWRLYDMLGRPVQEAALPPQQGNWSVNLSHLPAGLYQYRLEDTKGRSRTATIQLR